MPPLANDNDNYTINHRQHANSVGWLAGVKWDF